MLKYILVAIVFAIFGAASEFAAISVLPFFFFGLYFMMNVGPSGAVVLSLTGYIIYLFVIWLGYSRKSSRISVPWLVLSLIVAAGGAYLGTLIDDVSRLKAYVLFTFFPFAFASYVSFLKKDFEIPKSYSPVQLIGIFMDAIAPAGNSYYRGFNPLNAALGSLVVIVMYLLFNMDMVKTSLMGANIYLIITALIFAIVGAALAKKWRTSLEESFWIRSVYPILLWFSAYFILKVI